MNLADFQKLDAEQKKKVVLFAILGVMAVYALVTFGIGPFLDSARRNGMELESLRDKLQRAETAINREPKVRELVRTTREELESAAKQSIPPVENPLSWVAAQVYNSARQVGVDIQEVADLGVPTMPWARGKEDGPVFVPYTVRIVTECGYAELAALIRALEKDNPYLYVSDIQVGAQDSDVEHHRVRLSVQWPSWRDAEEANTLLSRGKAAIMPKHDLRGILLVALAMGIGLYMADAATSGPTEARDPFWPVGYEPHAAAPAETPKEEKLLDLSRLSPEEQAIIKAHLRVNGILRQGDQRVAIINSDIVREGETVSLDVRGQAYRFLIRSLRANNIVLEPVLIEDRPEE